MIRLRTDLALAASSVFNMGIYISRIVDLLPSGAAPIFPGFDAFIVGDICKISLYVIFLLGKILHALDSKFYITTS